MARVRALLEALSLVEKRERARFGTIATNNFFLATVVLLGGAGVFLLLLGALVVLFPLSADPMKKVPPERLEQFPLTAADRRWLRILSPWLNPIMWLLAALGLWSVRHVESASLLGLLAVLFGVGFFAPQVAGQPGFLRWVPAFPGRMGLFVQRGIRETLVTLDFWMALLVAVSGTVYRFAVPNIPEEARMMMTLLVVLALSSRGQSQFGLDSEAAIIRQRLMPLPGWVVLGAKNFAFLVVVLVLTLPMAPVTGLAAGLAALAIGNYPAVLERRPQTRWRFSAGAGIENGLVQVFALGATGAAAFRSGPVVLIPAALVCASSIWWFGRKLDQSI